MVNKKTTTKATATKKRTATKTAAAKKRTSTTTKTTAVKKKANSTAKTTVANKKAPVAAKTATAKKQTPAKKRVKATRKNIHKVGERTVTFRIQRGSTKGGVYKPVIQEFKVKFDDSTTILQALENIKAEQDGSLTFRRSCRASICGSCGVFVNGRSRLVCRTKVRDIVDGNPVKNRPGYEVVEIAPQKNQPVLKDLAVDIQPFYEKVAKIKPYIQEGAETQTKVDKTSFEQVNMVSNCIMCGCCYSDCTEMADSSDYIGPAALAKAFRFVSDPREGRKTERLAELSEKDGIWDCTRCGMCVDACPKDVAPMEAIAKLRTRAIDAGITANAGARHAMAFKDDLAKYGTLNEPMLLIKTCGVLGAVGQIGNALHLAKKGKIPSIFPHKIENLEEIQKIYDELEENPVDVETKQEDNGPGAG